MPAISEMSGFGRLSLMVKSSTFWMPPSTTFLVSALTSAPMRAATELPATPASHQRVRLWMTSSALKASPFDQEMPLRTCSVRVLASSLALPAFEQPGLEGEVGVPAHQIFVAVAGDVGHFDAVEGARVLEALDVHGDAQGAAALGLGGAGRGGAEAAQRQRAGGADAEAGHQGEIFAAADAALPEILGDGPGFRVQFPVGQHELHRRSLLLGAPCAAVWAWHARRAIADAPGRHCLRR